MKGGGGREVRVRGKGRGEGFRETHGVFLMPPLSHPPIFELVSACRLLLPSKKQYAVDIIAIDKVGRKGNGRVE